MRYKILGETIFDIDGFKRVLLDVRVPDDILLVELDRLYKEWNEEGDFYFFVEEEYEMAFSVLKANSDKVEFFRHLLGDEDRSALLLSRYDEKLKAEKLAEEKLKARPLRALKKLAAQKATATAHAKKGEMEKERGVQLWKNGPFWADRNIGAENPWDSGYYFRWGDTVGYKQKDDKWESNDGRGARIKFDDAPTSGWPSILLQKDGVINSDEILVSKYDAAQGHLHGSWRMPTKHEFNDLCNKCDWTWTKKNGVNGYVVCGKDEYASKSIFFPCVGQGYGTQLLDFGSHGYYWSSVPSAGIHNSWSLELYSGNHVMNSYCYRYLGRSIRPVRSFK